MENNKQELIKLVKENPDLPLVFMVYNDEIAFDYGSTVFEDFYSKVSEVYIMDETWTDDFYYVVDHYSDMFSDDDKYKDLTNEEYENEIKKYVNENVEHYKAIIVMIN